jgi:Zn-dependent metalloprotease
LKKLHQIAGGAAALLASLPAHAAPQIQIFSPGKPTTWIQAAPTDPWAAIQQALHLSGPTISETVLDTIRDNSALLGLKAFQSSDLTLLRELPYKTGSSLRFTQLKDGVPVDGAEMVALVGADGSVETLNSSLIDAPALSAQPELSREEALRIAIQYEGYQHPELGEGSRDGLLIVEAKRLQPQLVWQFSLREKEDGSNPVQIRIGAAGPVKGEIVRELSLGEPLHGRIAIYDASITLGTPNPLYKGVKVLDDGQVTWLGRRLLSNEAIQANETFTRVRTFYDQVFHRLSYDGKGADINVSVNVNRKMFVDPPKLRENAAWMGSFKMFGIGAGGKDLAGFTSAIDVIGHEFTHAVVSTTCDLDYGGQSGALNEHLADLFGAMAQSYDQPQSKPFLIGETVLRGNLARSAQALRDMLDPHQSLGWQPANMAEIPQEYDEDCQQSRDNDECGVHLLNGIPNRATALIVQKLGWERTRELFYNVMTARLRSSSDFRDYRDQMIAECDRSLTRNECTTVRAAFDQVGL